MSNKFTPSCYGFSDSLVNAVKGVMEKKEKIKSSTEKFDELLNEGNNDLLADMSLIHHVHSGYDAGGDPQDIKVFRGSEVKKAYEFAKDHSAKNGTSTYVHTALGQFNPLKPHINEYGGPARNTTYTNGKYVGAEGNL